MYVKLFNQILDSSIADNRRLRHFFIDLLLCSDPDGCVRMTKTAIATRIRTDVAEVEWGLAELQKPDPLSLHPENEGRRIAPLEGHGYGWKILNYELYRDLKSAQHLREQTAQRVQRYRERRAGRSDGKRKRTKGPSGAEQAYTKAVAAGNETLAEQILESSLPTPDPQPAFDTWPIEDTNQTKNP